jgi:formate dehydrogenase major subunit
VYVFTTYRLTEHHTAGGMSRTLPYLSELQPEPFCEVTPRLAAERGLEHLGWATIVTARTAIEARVLVTVTMDPNVFIQDKVGTCDIRPGRRPRGEQLLDYVEEYRDRAGIGRPGPTEGEDGS